MIFSNACTLKESPLHSLGRMGHCLCGSSQEAQIQSGHITLLLGKSMALDLKLCHVKLLLHHAARHQRRALQSSKEKRQLASTQDKRRHTHNNISKVGDFLRAASRGHPNLGGQESFLRLGRLEMILKG